MPYPEYPQLPRAGYSGFGIKLVDLMRSIWLDITYYMNYKPFFISLTLGLFKNFCR